MTCGVPYSSQQPISLGQLNNVQIDTSTLVNDEVIAFNSASNTWKNVNAGTTHTHNEISQLDSNVTVTDTGANGLISFTTDGVLEASINGTNGLNLVTSKLTVNGVDGNAGDVLTSDGVNVSWVAPTHPLPDNEISQLNSSVIVTDTGANGLVTTTIDGTVTSAINSAGLGVGITPVELLDLKANPYTGDCRVRLDAPTGFDTEIKFSNNGTVEYTIGHDDGTDNFVIGTTNVDTPLVSVDKAGDVGIGTDAPAVKLDIKETTSNIAGEIILGGALVLDNIPFGKFNFANTAAANTQTNKILASIAGEKVGSSNKGDLTFATSNSASPAERMRITAEGNVGIGTDDPATQLNVSGTTGIRITYTGASSAGVGAPLTLYTDDGAAVASGDRLGYVIIGGAYDAANNLGSQLSINGYASETWSATNRGSELTFDTTANASTSRTSRMKIAQDGNVGIGVGAADPQEKLHIYNAGEVKQEIESNTLDAYLIINSGSDGVGGANREEGAIKFYQDNADFFTLGKKNDGQFSLRDHTAGQDVILFQDNGGIMMTPANNKTQITGNLGVGIIPIEVLDLRPVSYTGDCRVRLDAPTGSDTEIKFFNNGTAEYTIGHDDATDNFVIGTTNVDAPLVSVDKAGSVGIGTSLPTAGFMLDVTKAGGTGIRITDSTNGSSLRSELADDTASITVAKSGAIPTTLILNTQSAAGSTTPITITEGGLTAQSLALDVGGGLNGLGPLSISTTAIDITGVNDYGSLVIVAGNSGGNIFSDLVYYATTMGHTVLVGGTVSGGPAGRTYTVVGSKLKLAMSAGTYSVSATTTQGTL